MKNCFSCLRKIKFYFRSRKTQKKWLTYLQNYCSTHTKYQWCELIIQHFEQLKNYTNASEQTLRQLRSTNISSQIIKVMRKDYELKQNPFTLTIDIFVSYIVNKYQDVQGNNNGTNSNAALTKFSSQCENFVDFMRSLMVIYYVLEERELIGDDQFFRVTLSNFITQCLFLRQEFYNCVIQITKVSCKQSQERIAFNMQKFKNLSLHQYEISPKYTLDAQTLSHFDVPLLVSSKPYLGPIKLVKQIIKSRTPVEKTKCAENLLSQIQFSIRKFYEDNKINQAISLDADNAIAIMLYILVQSEQSQLLMHLNIVYYFLNKEMLAGKLGFCLDMLKACLQFLQKGTLKRSRGLNVQQSDFSLWINARSYFQYIGNK